MKFLTSLLFLLSFYLVNAQNSEIKKISIHSNSLKENRDLTIYFPENFSSNKKYNVFFMTDGQFLNEDYKIKVDSLIEKKIIPELIIVGVNSNEKDIPNSYFQIRNYEYIENFNDAPDSKFTYRFSNHLDFFINEVNVYIKKELNVKVKRRFFYGVSNGAGFGISLVKKYPKFFKGYILYSVAGANQENIKKSNNDISKIIIRYGDKEAEPLVENNIDLIKFLKANEYNIISSSYIGGHKRIDWLNNFIQDIQKFNL